MLTPGSIHTVGRGVPLAREFVLVQTTLDDRDVAAQLVREAVNERLAACGQITGPVESTYWWRGAIEVEEEWLCVFKTTRTLAQRLGEFLLARHPYEVPEIVIIAIDGTSRDYGEWIREETGE
jgi:periplasmic divalent cation tolerance protein